MTAAAAKGFKLFSLPKFRWTDHRANLLRTLANRLASNDFLVNRSK